MLSTIGYEGAEPQAFLRTLLLSGITKVVDVRDRAQSRRPGFSKSALSSSLSAAGIDYVHLRELGDPKEGRDAARANDFERFRRIYAAVLKTESAQEAIRSIAALCETENVCLLCYEREPLTCHRNVVAGAIRELIGVKIRHLGVLSIEQAGERERRMRHPSEGAAA